MEENELRIGNRIMVQFENQPPEELKCTIRDIFTVQTSTPNSKFQYTPIPLTEEWLVKFGFKKSLQKDSRLYDFGGLTIVTSDKSDSIDSEGRTYWNSWTIFRCQPKYVHQLQNLYFALTGTELTINN